MEMGARENLQRLADRKTQEISDLHRQIDMANAYLQAIQDSIKALPRELPLQVNAEDASGLRPGTLLARAREALQKNGKPMHINALLEAIGLDNTKSARVSLVGSLGAYVRKGTIFVRPGPNIFGLVGMQLPTATSDEGPFSGLPDSFGEVSQSI
jgi:hypothetical protein